MTVKELNRAQLKRLKTRYYEERHPEGVSYVDLANIDNLVKDGEIIEAYEGIDFLEEDFYNKELIAENLRLKEAEREADPGRCRNKKIHLTNEEKAKRFDALQAALKATRDRYTERKKESRRIYEKTPNSQRNEISAFEYGRAEAYKAVIEDLERWII